MPLISHITRWTELRTSAGDSFGNCVPDRFPHCERRARATRNCLEDRWRALSQVWGTHPGRNCATPQGQIHLVRPKDAPRCRRNHQRDFVRGVSAYLWTQNYIDLELTGKTQPMFNEKITRTISSRWSVCRSSTTSPMFAQPQPWPSISSRTNWVRKPSTKLFRHCWRLCVNLERALVPLYKPSKRS